MFYRPHKTILCDICDDNDCGEGCYKEEETGSSESPLGSMGITITATSLYVMILLGVVCHYLRKVS